MKYQAIKTVTRPNTSIPFYPPGSIHAPTTETDWTTSESHRYFVQTYVNTGKCDLTQPSLSDDGLVLTYTAIYRSPEYIAELYNDNYFESAIPERTAYFEANQIECSEETVTIIE
jgi:hypothetical protein